MDDHRFDTMTKRIAAVSSRRSLLGGLAGGALAALLGRAAAGQEAARGGGGRPTGRCLGEKKECRRGAQCCSGVCKGKRGKKKCRRAPGQGTCTTDRNVCAVGNPGIGCNGDFACACAVTTGGTAFCGSLFGDSCAACASGADCVGLGFPAGSACIPVGGDCEDCPAAGGTKCLLPC